MCDVLNWGADCIDNNSSHELNTRQHLVNCSILTLNNPFPRVANEGRTLHIVNTISAYICFVAQVKEKNLKRTPTDTILWSFSLVICSHTCRYYSIYAQAATSANTHQLIINRTKLLLVENQYCCCIKVAINFKQTLTHHALLVSSLYTSFCLHTTGIKKRVHKRHLFF